MKNRLITFTLKLLSLHQIFEWLKYSIENFAPERNETDTYYIYHLDISYILLYCVPSIKPYELALIYVSIDITTIKLGSNINRLRVIR